MQFFRTSAPLHEKYGDVGSNCDQLINLKFNNHWQMQAVVGRWLRETSRYECTHPDFPEQLSKLQRIISWLQRKVKCHLIVRLCNHHLILLQLKKQLWQQQQQYKKMYLSLKLFAINSKLKSFTQQQYFDICMQQWKKSCRC